MIVDTDKVLSKYVYIINSHALSCVTANFASSFLFVETMRFVRKL